MTDTARTIKVVIDPAGAKAGADRVNDALRSIGDRSRDAAKGLADVDRRIKAANDNSAGLKGSLNKVASGLNTSTVAAKLFGAAIGTAVIGASIAFVKLADTYGTMEAKLRIATGSAKAYATASADIVRIANESRSSLTATADLYLKTMRNADKLGLSQQGVALATMTFTKVLKVGGASAQEASSAILQLSQAMGAGVLQGDEFKSLMETAPEFMKILATSMDVPMGQLKKLGSEGKITGQQISKALTDPKIVAEIETQFGKIPRSFGDVTTSIQNTLIRGAGALFKGLGIETSLAVIIAHVNKFADSIEPKMVKIGQTIRNAFNTVWPVLNTIGGVIGWVANNFGLFTSAVVIAGSALAAWKLGGIVHQMIGFGATLLANGGFAGLFSAAMWTARNAMIAFNVAVAANPIGFVATAITTAIVLLWKFRDAIKLGTDGGATLGDAFSYSFKLIGQGFSKLADVASKVTKSVGDFFKKYLGPVATLAKKVFGDINIGLFGVAQVAASVVDLIAGFFIRRFNLVKNVVVGLMQTAGNAVGTVTNFVISNIESMVNSAINGLNAVINLANKIPKVDISTVQTIKLDRVKVGGPVDFGIDEAKASGAGGIGARRGLDAYATGLDAHAAERRRQRAANDPANDNDTSNDDTGNPTADAADSAKDAAKSSNDFWSNLTKARDAAGLVGFELEKHNSYLELSEELGRKINDAEKSRIDKLLIETATLKTIAELKQDTLDIAAASALAQQKFTLLQTRGVEAGEAEFDIISKVAERRREMEKTGADMASEATKQALDQYEAELRINAERERGNKLLTERLSLGDSLIKRYAREANPAGAALTDRNERDAAINGAVRPADVSVDEWQRQVSAALRGSAREYEKSLTDIHNKWRDDMLSSVRQIGDAFGGKIGDAINKVASVIEAMSRSAQGDHSQGGILGGLSKLLGGAEGNRNGFGKAFDNAAKAFTPEGMAKALKDPIASFAEGAKEVGKIAKGGMAEGAGGLMGKMMGGSMVGSLVGGIGSMISKKFSSTGSEIGGMLGGMLGPIGGLLGSLGGGLLGGLFGGRKVASGRAAITLDEMTGTLQIASSGKHGGEAGAVDLANKVVSGITSIASRLGATLGGTPTLAVGKNGDDFRVSATGGEVTGKKGTNFKTEGEAIDFALKDLINDGLLQGISDFSARFLKAAKNLDAAVGVAENYEKVLKSLNEMNDPITTAIKGLTDNLDRLTKQMTLGGATAAELAKLEEYRSKKLTEMMEDQIKGLTGFRKDLMGEGTGVTAMNRFVAAQREFDKLHQTVKAGGSVDQDKFTESGQDVLKLASEIYGTSSSQFQAIRQMLLSATDGAIDNVKKMYDDAAVQAINQQTEAIVSNQVVQNDLLREIAKNLSGQGGSGVFGQPSSFNGSLRYATV